MVSGKLFTTHSINKLMVDIIQDIKSLAGDERKSVTWYMNEIKKFTKPTSAELIRQGKRSSRPFFGKLNMFMYNPKLKNELPYYDIFPLVLPIERYKDGFLGINFHYLPNSLRIKLLSDLMKLKSNNKFDETTIIRARYAKLAQSRFVKPTLKRYLYKKAKSQYRRVDADEFTIATLLPVQQFRKANETRVYADSRKMI
jgi:hypothetical protein|tara:strand:+ start:1332 stop:1928 length:597 start_codon:yes stop_codon:yes gene_type:complete